MAKLVPSAFPSQPRQQTTSPRSKFLVRHMRKRMLQGGSGRLSDHRPHGPRRSLRQAHSSTPCPLGFSGTSYSEREIFSTYFPLHCPDPQWPQGLFPRLRRPISLIWQGFRLLLVGLVKVVLFLMSPERPLHDFIFITHILHNMRGEHDEQ